MEILLGSFIGLLLETAIKHIMFIHFHSFSSFFTNTLIVNGDHGMVLALSNSILNPIGRSVPQDDSDSEGHCN